MSICKLASLPPVSRQQLKVGGVHTHEGTTVAAPAQELGGEQLEEISSISCQVRGPQTECDG